MKALLQGSLCINKTEKDRAIVGHVVVKYQMKGKMKQSEEQIKNKEEGKCQRLLEIVFSQQLLENQMVKYSLTLWQLTARDDTQQQ